MPYTSTLGVILVICCFCDKSKKKSIKGTGLKVLFPYHYGQTDVSGVPAQLRGEGIDVRIRHYE